MKISKIDNYQFNGLKKPKTIRRIIKYPKISLIHLRKRIEKSGIQEDLLNKPKKGRSAFDKNPYK